MGMFDYVKYRAKCFNCGHPLETPEWQTKSAKDDESFMRKLEVSEVAEDFYADCPKCNAWNEYDVRNGIPRLKGQEELPVYMRLKPPPHA